MTLAAFETPRSVYVHVPFCVHRCGYCDFTLVAGRDDLQDDYLRALELEMQTIVDRPVVDTVFLGGGTPTQLTAPRLERLLALLKQRFDWAENGEFSVEANPIGLTDNKLRVLKDAGINRISLGVQSFDARVLATLERDHREPEIVTCIELVRRYCDNFGIDLIFAVPGQSLELWNQTLRRAIEFAPTHISTYGLTFEKGTSFWSRRSKGLIEPADNDLELVMYEAAMDQLAAAGLAQYEISNFAKPGFASRHNQVYWAGRPYWGFGPGAASYLHGERRLNHRSTTTWIQRVLAGQSVVYESERLEPEHRARELLVLGLRTIAGVERARFRITSGFDLDALAGRQMQRLQQQGLINDHEQRVTLTRAGLCLADFIAGKLL